MVNASTVNSAVRSQSRSRPGEEQSRLPWGLALRPAPAPRAPSVSPAQHSEAKAQSAWEFRGDSSHLPRSQVGVEPSPVLPESVTSPPLRGFRTLLRGQRLFLCLLVFPKRLCLRHGLRRRHVPALRPPRRPGAAALLARQHHLRDHFRGVLKERPPPVSRLRRLQL